MENVLQNLKIKILPRFFDCKYLSIIEIPIFLEIIIKPWAQDQSLDAEWLKRGRLKKMNHERFVIQLKELKCT